MDKRVVVGVVTLVCLVWTVTIVTAIFVPTYSPPPEVHLAFTTIVGGAVALEIKGKPSKDVSDGNGSH